jgi:flagellar hook assembly protein FlgD
MPQIAESRLMQNYPNPCNPETWIPYQLAEPGNVTIGIYSSSGQLVRTLDLGHKAVGSYASKDSAARWDGTNEAGENVSSGLYFYVIKSGTFTATRKMIISR